MEALSVESGRIFNSLTIIKEAEPKTINGKRPKRQFLCQCVCGKHIIVRLDALRNNKKSSCGCRLPVKIILTGNHVETHGLSYKNLYKRWKKIKGRCYRKNDQSYDRYGGRGIRMSDEWFSNPVSFYEWSMTNGYSQELELDRIDNNKGYSADNCRWTTSEINNNNKRSNIKYTYKGELLTLPQISRKCNIGFPTLYRRINENKLSLEEALSIPLQGKCKKEPNAGRVLSFNQVIEIYNSNDKVSHLTKIYNVHESTIRGIKTRTRYIDFTNQYIKSND